MKIAITGATGFIARVLVDKLLEANHSLLLLVRNPERARNLYPNKNLEIVSYVATQSGSWQDSLDGCDAVINLAGEPIADRWSNQYKQKILQSRQIGTQKIVEAIAKASSKPKILINASAIGYYGSSQNETFDENSGPAEGDFLSQVCQLWEAEAKQASNFGTRVAILRFGIVLGSGGGALGRMLPAFEFFAGGPIGTGTQWFSWIHILDLVNLIIFTLDHREMEGCYNATAPNPVKMFQFCETLAKVLNRPCWLPVPSIAMELLLGEGAQVVLQGQKVLPKRTLDTGFTYNYPDLEQALKQILLP